MTPMMIYTTMILVSLVIFISILSIFHGTSYGYVCDDMRGSNYNGTNINSVKKTAGYQPYPIHNIQSDTDWAKICFEDKIESDRTILHTGIILFAITLFALILTQMYYSNNE